MNSQSGKVTEGLDGERLDVAATHLLQGLSRKKIKSIIDNGGAYVNKKRILFAKHVVKVGDKIEFFWKESPKEAGLESGKNGNATDRTNPSHARQSGASALGAKAPKTSYGDPIGLDVVIFSHNDFWIINKPAGIASQSTLDSIHDTILMALHQLDPEKFPTDQLRLVHRLDKDTSGLMIVARNGKAQNWFEQQFQKQKVSKTYEALCLGIPKTEKGTVDLAIARDPSRPNACIAVYPNQKSWGAKPAQTEWAVQAAFPQTQSAHITCHPKTGRTHQIRVHLTSLGTPLMGDRTYGTNVIGHPLQQKALRHMLHARTLVFQGPDGQTHSFEAPLPPDFLECLQAMEG